MADGKVEILIDGDTSGFESKVKNIASTAENAVEDTTKAIESETKKVVSKVKEVADEVEKQSQKTTEEVKNDFKDTENQSEKTSEKVKDDFKDTEKQAEVSADEMKQAFTDVGSTIEKGMNIAIGAVVAVGTALGALATNAVKYNSQIENYTTSFEVMTGSAEEALEVVDKLKDIGASTPFELPQLADTTQLLMNYGFTADGAIDKMMMLGDISQGNAEKMSRVATAYGQMSSAGKVSLGDIKQMIESGFNPLQEISETTGESMESLYDRISKGSISVDEITDSMKRSTSEGGKYFQSMEKQSKTLQGQFSTLKDNAQQLLGEVFQPLSDQIGTVLLPALIGYFDTLNQSGKLDQLKQAIVELSTKIIDTVLTVLPTAIDWFIKIVQNIEQITRVVTVSAVAWKAFTIIQSVVSFVQGFIKAITLAKTALVAYNATIAISTGGMSLLIAGVGALVAGIVTLIATQGDSEKQISAVESKYGDLNRKIDDEIKSYKELKKAQKEQAEEDLTQVANTERLANELDRLVDENGNVLDANKDRVNYILNELNGAYGTEYTLADGVIQKYQEMQTEIDNLIQKKKAETMLNAVQPIYDEAVNNEKKYRENNAEAILILENQKNKYEQLTNEIIALENEHQKAFNEQNFALEADLFKKIQTKKESLEEEKTLLEEVQNVYNESNDLLQQSYKDRVNIEQAMVEASNDNYSSVIGILDEFNSSYSVAMKSAGESIEEQQKVASHYYNLALIDLNNYAKEYVNGTEGYTLEGLQVAIANTSQMAEEVGKNGGKLKDGFLTGLDGLEVDVQAKLDELAGLSIPEVDTAFNDLGIKSIEEYNQGSESQKGNVETTSKGIFDKSISPFENTKGIMRGLGVDGGNGYVEGIRSRGFLTYNAGFFLGTQMEKGIKDGQQSASPSKVAIRLGEDAGDGYAIGIENSATEVYNNAKAIANNAMSALSDVNLSELLENDENNSKKFDSKVEILDYQKDFGLSDEEYYKQLEILRDEYLTKNTKEWYDCTKDIYDYKIETAEKSEKSEKEAIENKFKELDKRLEYGLISEEDYYNELEKLANKYYDKDSEEFKENEFKIKKFRDEMRDNEIQSHFDALDKRLGYGLISEEDYYNELLELANKYYDKDSEEYKKHVDELNDYAMKQHESLTDTMLGGFETFTTETVDILGFDNAKTLIAGRDYSKEDLLASGIGGSVTSTVLANTKEYSDKMKLYTDNMKALLDSGVSDDFREYLLGLSMDEGVQLTTELLSLSEEDKKEFLDSWNGVQSLATTNASIVLSERAKELKGRLIEEFGECPDEFLNFGDESGLKFSEGFMKSLNTLLADVKLKLGNALQPLTTVISSTSYSDNRVTNITANGVTPHSIIESQNQSIIYQNHTKGFA